MERLWIDLRCTEHVPSLRDSVDFPAYPGLTSWVIMFRPWRGWASGAFVRMKKAKVSPAYWYCRRATSQN